MTRMILPATLLAATALATPASALTLAALVDDATIAIVDIERLATVREVAVSGLDGALLGIDVRSSDGLLYGVVADGTIVTIDPETGAASEVSRLDTMLPEGVAAIVDFNPAADRLRLMGSDGTSLRVNVDTGEVVVDGSHAFAAGDAFAEATPRIVTGAYTNAIGRPSSTMLFNIDEGAGALVLQDPPNDGVLNTVGGLGLDATGFAMDIHTPQEGENVAYLMADARLATVDLGTGEATAIGRVEGLDGDVRDIAILPAM